MPRLMSVTPVPYTPEYLRDLRDLRAIVGRLVDRPDERTRTR